MNIIELFKNDLWNGIWQHAKRLFRYIAIPVMAVIIMFIAISYYATQWIIESGIIPEYLLEAGGDIAETMQKQQKIIEALMENLGTIAPLVIAIIVISILVVAWILNVLLKISKSLVETNEANVNKALSTSFDRQLVNLIGYAILLLVANWVVSYVVELLPLPSLIMFGIKILVIIFFLRFFAGRAAIVIGGLGVSDSVKFSWSNIHMGRATKLFLVLFVGVIFIGLGMALVGAILSLVGSIGTALALSSFILISVFVAALLVSGLSASFYRYAEVEYESTDEQHLIDDDLSI